MRAKPGTVFALIASLAAMACQAAPEPPARSDPSRVTLDQPVLGVMTSLPLIWGEAEDIGELLQPEPAAAWVRQELERRFTLAPLDVLEANELGRLDRLLLAQPRALSPPENVALDAWVRGGGKLLLFADPMLTRHSRFPVGDRRRPQDVVLLSPILARWGLELQFDEDQPAGEQTILIDGIAVPVDLGGRLRVMADSRCALAGDGLVARCRIGAGKVLVLADAVVLDDAEAGDPELRRAALARILAMAFD